MLRYCPIVVAAALVAGVVPAAAAVTRAAAVEETPRAAWFDRYQDARRGPEQTEPYTGTFKVDPSATVDLNHISGDVRVTVGRGSEVRIEAIKRVRHRDAAEGKRLLAALRVEVNQVGGRLEIRTVFPRTENRGFNGSVDYTLVVPQNAGVSLKTISGDISVTAVQGEVRAETISGNVDVVATPNLAFAKAVSGNVHARDISATTLTLSTISGSVIASALKVRTLEAGTVSGNLQLADLHVERLSAKTLSGDILFEGTLARGGRYELNAHSGNVRLTLPGNVAGFELDASTFSGSVRSDFPIALRSSGGGDAGRRSSANRAIRGTFGDASSILSLRSFSGSVVIARR